MINWISSDDEKNIRKVDYNNLCRVINFVKDQRSDNEMVKYACTIFDETKNWLDIYFSGKIPTFTPKYKIENLTPFRKQVIDILNTIPYGKTITYKDIANDIAKEKGIEKNDISSFIIPKRETNYEKM